VTHLLCSHLYAVSMPPLLFRAGRHHRSPAVSVNVISTKRVDGRMRGKGYRIWHKCYREKERLQV
jgi:hypothetical protein